jgi:predicted nucleic-acid-binding protein
VIGLDTNVVIRYMAQDEPRQAAAAARLMEQTLSADNPGFISIVAICEIAWVLADCYAADRARIRTVMEVLLGTRLLVVESPELVWKALRAWQASAADLSDALIGELAAARGAGKTVTFDRAAARLPGLELLV